MQFQFNSDVERQSLKWLEFIAALPADPEHTLQQPGRFLHKSPSGSHTQGTESGSQRARSGALVRHDCRSSDSERFGLNQI